ncbi:MAG: hypothetical protein HY781_07850 [Chloroflexi bacterium]|nr:hypothetical protein [Chloroflexota bacterium]
MKSKQLSLLPSQPDPDRIVSIPIEQLLLDTENPRLAWRAGSNTQSDMVKLLWSEMAVDEVAFSIAENGYFRSEPLFVIIQNPEESNPAKRKYIVVEGNRRLAAVMLLRDEKLREKVRALDLPIISDERRASLDSLPAILYSDREQLWTTIGFRHINGIKPWDSFSKAKYIAEVYESYKVPLEEIAQKIGDRHATVVRLYRGYKILEQAETQAGFDKEDRERNRFYFSHLYTAADQKEYQEFLGIRPDKTSLKPNPVPKTMLPNLAELMTYLYGKKSVDKKPVVQTQNPDLNILREVISKPESLSALRSGYSLAVAYNVAIGDQRRFRDALTSAKVELQKAKATVTTGYTGEDDLYKLVQDTLKVTDSLKDEMEKIRIKFSSEEHKTE